jgi:hypothetical protein
MQNTRLTVLALVSAAFAVTACGAEAQKFAATDTGDLSNPPAERILSALSFAEHCGSGEFTERGQGSIYREPYLQNVTADSATVLFTTNDGAQSGDRVEVTLPGGPVVASAPIELDVDGSDRQWRARITGLEAAQVYCYSIPGVSEPVGFRTAPAPGSGSAVRFAVFGDSGDGSSGQVAVRDQLATVPMDLMLHTGDIAYGGGSVSDLEKSVFDVYEDLLRSIPLFPTTGNHDYETSAANPFRQVFELPGNGSAETDERWYSFDWGDIHFVALDTELVGDQQIAWLEGDLMSNQLPWTIVYLHKPPYSSGEHGSATKVRAAFSPLFEAYGVQLVLAGHEHDYERTKPMGGVTYIVTGGGGKSTRSVGHSSFTAFSEDVLHFVFAEVEGDTMILHAIDATGQEFDSVRIKAFDNG